MMVSAVPWEPSVSGDHDAAIEGSSIFKLNSIKAGLLADFKLPAFKSQSRACWLALHAYVGGSMRSNSAAPTQIEEHNVSMHGLTCITMTGLVIFGMSSWLGYTSRREGQ